MPAEHSWTNLATLPPSPAGEAAIARLTDAAIRQGVEDRLSERLQAAAIGPLVATALGDCPFLLECAERAVSDLIDLFDDTPAAWSDAQCRAAVAAAALPPGEAMTALRIARRRLALGVALADLSGIADLDAVTAALSTFADTALRAALGVAVEEARQRGTWAGPAAIADDFTGLVFLAMGKHGAGELNYSSDIDLIALYDPEAEGLSSGTEPSVFWVRIVRRIVAILQERTADGYVFRVDLRLRPDPGSTPVALSTPAALQYYESMGQNWERAALIKARPAAGDVRCGARFLQEIAPFIWRKHLDFAAITDIHSIKRQIHAHRGHGTVRVAGHDIKRGRGGIREVELFVQTQQLIAGGRDPKLRGRRTREMLAMLAERNWIEAGVRDGLDSAYCRLRNVEHRLQMVRDEQTHTLPDDEDGIARIARLCGDGDPDAFAGALLKVLERVSRRYSRLFEHEEALSVDVGNLVFTGDDDDPGTLATLAQMGFADPSGAIGLVKGWHFCRYAATRSARAREHLTELTPRLLRALSAGGDPDQALRAFDALIRSLPTGVQLFALLASNPDLLDLLTLVLGTAPRLAETFARRPQVANALVDPTILADVAGRDELTERLATTRDQAESFEDILDRVRLFAAEHRFLVSVRLISGVLSPVDAGHAFSDLAEVVAQALLAAVLAEFRSAHGEVPGQRVALVAFGRLGSREMTATSDLDLIVIYDHAEDARQSDGRRPLAPSQYFIRLTQRLIAALSAPTAEGVAYEVDLRLRPSGKAGPLATRRDAFFRYQQADAWAWEHLALTRARPIAGDASLVADIAAGIASTVGGLDRGESLAADILAMREKIDEARAGGGKWALKTARGGLMDLEFLAQHLVLTGLELVPGECLQTILARARADRVLPRDDGAILAYSAAFQSAALQTLRVLDAKGFDPAEASEAVVRLVAEFATDAATPFAADLPDSFQSLMNSTAQGNAQAPMTGDALDGRLTIIQEETRRIFDERLRQT